MAAQPGFEPGTNRLTGDGSAAELLCINFILLRFVFFVGHSLVSPIPFETA